ncbi:unnamed protein product [marine sediment metagenome]|uniref:Uncharacterized protein n=1 Tax=marine sediment metagenome TaxID=412755 RepID=X1RBH3_9ZZZZ
MNTIEIIRAIVRPYVSFILISAIVIMGIILILKFGTEELAKTFAIFILGSGATIIGFHFGERAAKK